MPKPITIYACVCCSRRMADYDDCFNHECQHFNLSRDEYKEWEILTKQVFTYKSMLQRNRRTMITPSTEIQINLEHATQRLEQFESEHNLVDKQNPWEEEYENTNPIPY